MATQQGITGTEGQYKQELHRDVGVLGNIAITLSAVTPASSVFIIIPFLILTAGTGSFLDAPRLLQIWDRREEVEFDVT